MPKNYPQFDYPASELSAFAVSAGIFVISLKNGEIVKHEPKDSGKFLEWLLAKGIRNINKK